MSVTTKSRLNLLDGRITASNAFFSSLRTSPCPRCLPSGVGHGHKSPRLDLPYLNASFGLPSTRQLKIDEKSIIGAQYPYVVLQLFFLAFA